MHRGRGMPERCFLRLRIGDLFYGASDRTDIVTTAPGSAMPAPHELSSPWPHGAVDALGGLARGGGGSERRAAAYRFLATAVAP